VLLLGESGAGKGVCARAVHELSGRPGAFVAVNCGAVPERAHRGRAPVDARDGRFVVVPYLRMQPGTGTGA
jgi:transcriptional regulator of acetoin/glycerol metabolism